MAKPTALDTLPLGLPQWEYHVERIRLDGTRPEARIVLREWLNAKGLAGWELVSVAVAKEEYSDNQQALVFLKRLKE